MKNIRAKIRERTGRKALWFKDVREVIQRLNPILRGWGEYYRTGNAMQKFVQLDRYLWWRLMRLMVRRKGRNLKANDVKQWTHNFFVGHGLHQFRGTVRYPEAA